MIFKNIKNRQIANIVDNKLIQAFEKDNNWKKMKNYNFNEDNNYKELNKYARIEQLKYELAKITEDIIQMQVGEYVPGIDKKKGNFILLHNE